MSAALTTLSLLPLVAAVDDAAFLTAAAAAVAAALSAGVAAWQGLLMKRSERNRTQPIVVVYERAEPNASADGSTQFAVSMANEGAGPAFNVRFGVSIGRSEALYTPQPAGAQGAGDVPRALGPGRTLPEGGSTYLLTVPYAPDSLDDRVYWCRYENAFGDTWETRNAWRPERELEIAAVGRS
jgi:hypothetical protein